jgi:hypothetical protein
MGDWHCIDGTMDNIVAVEVVEGDPDNVVDLAQSIRQAGWDQIARGGPWPHEDVVVSMSLSPEQWTFVLASLEIGIDNADPDDAEEAEEAAEMSGVRDLVSAQVHPAA